ncbi:sulfatase [Rhodopirellula sp.]|nr:sulfatase [bacterium]MDB4474939.1 sulfatase [bacterium]MDB4477283.1 sulfatase [Rhodopirellula sp.]
MAFYMHHSFITPTFTARIFILTLQLLACVALKGEETNPQPKIKNVLFIISDDLRANTLGCYGDRFCKTPNIDKLARAGMLFERAYCQGTSCGPSRRSLMFSRYQGTSKVNMGQYFREQGWYTARVGKIYHMRVPGDIIAGTNGEDIASSWTERFNSPGLEAHTPGDYACLNLNVFTEALEARESTKMPNRMFVTVQYDGDGSDQPDFKSANKAIELLRKHREDPFFLAVGLVRPHYPMVAPREYFTPYPWQEMQLPSQQTGDLTDIPKAGQAKTISSTNPIGKHPDNQRRMWSGYYASVSFMDEQVGKIINELDALGLRDSTAIVFTSDHGYHLGDHQFWQKSNLHEQVLRVPLVMSVPGLPTGRSGAVVELVDIYPTVCELTGQRVPDEVQGTSLVPLLNKSSNQIKSGALSFHNGFSLRTPEWHYMRYTDGSRELYDMNADPGEFTNLAKTADATDRLQQLERVLQTRLSKAGIKAKIQNQKERKNRKSVQNPESNKK